MSLANILFLDIETVPMAKNLHDMPSDFQTLYEKRFSKKVEEEGVSFNNHWTSNAGLYAEFGRIACVSIGTMTKTKFYIKTIVGTDEYKILTQLSEAFEKVTAKIYCAHNGKEFDFPFLMRKYIMHGLKLPDLLNIFGKKPWEVNLEDTMVMWSGTQWNYKVSLDLLCNSLGLQSPKTEMSGSSVFELYYEWDQFPEGLPFDKQTQALERIGKYCAGDVLALANCYARMKGIEIIKPEDVQYV